jgi:hypothetical protein
MWHVRAGLAAAAVTAFVTPAWAQDTAAAVALFERGLSAMEAGRYAEGCPALEESYRLEPLPGVLFTSAECHAKWRKLATAVARYQDYLSAFERMPISQQKKQRGRDRTAERQVRELSARVPKLTLVLPESAPPQTKVLRGGVALGRPSLNVALPVDPGEHVLVTQVPGGEAHEQRISIAEGETKRVTLEVRLPETTEPEVVGAPTPSDGTVATPSDRPSARASLRPWAWIAGGIGVAGIAVGSVSGALVFSKKSEVIDNCQDTACNPQGKDAADSAKTLGLVSTIGFAVGGAGIVTAVALLLAEPRAEKPAQHRHRPIIALSEHSAIFGVARAF